MSSRIIQKLLTWYRRHGRDLPWRKTTQPYPIFVSEMMLQQTQVDRVIPFYRAFLKRFPNWKTLANAKTADLIHAWAGLGYNRRALYLRESARVVIANGEPTNEKEWRMLKGVGPYAAAALAAFVNGERTTVIDTNIRRVIGRSFLGIPYPSLADDDRVRRALTTYSPRRIHPSELPQALMDLGAAICTARSPSCAVCPLREACASSRRFLSAHPPQPRRRATTERRHAEKPFPDRIYRGRILAWVRLHGATPVSDLGSSIDTEFSPREDATWLRAMVARLAKDGLLIMRRGDIVSLPHS